MKKIKPFSSLSFNIISFIIVLLIFFSLVLSTIGFISFTNAFKREYSETSYHMASTASILVNADHLDDYLENGENDEYTQSQGYLDIYCSKMNISLIYVIKVDQSDYGSFVSIFNSVNNTVDNTSYSPWPLGYQRKATNDEYIQKYKKLYEGNTQYETIYRTTNLNGTNPHLTVLVPLRDYAGDVVAIMCIQRPISELISARRPYLVNVIISVVAISITTAFITVFYLRKQFVNPMKFVSNEAKRFAKENSKGEKLHNISKITEIHELAVSVDKMEEDMLSYIDRLTNITKEKERIGAELHIATMIQENSIPNKFPAFPSRTDFNIYASMTPAKEVGGDFYNFFLIDDDHLAIVIADVSGKGIPAALFMMVTNILISDRTKMGGTPSEILSFVNQEIYDHNEAEMFVTVWLGIVCLSTGKLIASNAGHDDPFIYHNHEKFESEKRKHGLVLGGMDGMKYTDYEIDLKPGDKLFVYTDGITEATNKDKELYGKERLVETLNQCKDLPPEEILGFVHNSVNEFVGDEPQFDDMTMLCFEMKEKDDKTVLKIEAQNENLHKVTDFIDSFLEKNECLPKAQTQIDLSIEEIFVNISNYAYKESIGICEIELELKGNNIHITFKDHGTPFNPLAKPDPDNTLSADERQIGGLGVFLVKKNMDDVIYNYIDNMNVLTLIKKIK